MKHTIAAIYARVSTDGQTVAVQMEALREFARRSGGTIYREFTDQAKAADTTTDARLAWAGYAKPAGKK